MSEADSLSYETRADNTMLVCLFRPGRADTDPDIWKIVETVDHHLEPGENSYVFYEFRLLCDSGHSGITFANNRCSTQLAILL